MHIQTRACISQTDAHATNVHSFKRNICYDFEMFVIAFTEPSDIRSKEYSSF